MDNEYYFFLMNVYVRGLYTEAQVNTLIKKFVPKSEIPEFFRLVNESVLSAIDEEPNDDLRALLKKSFENSGVTKNL